MPDCRTINGMLPKTRWHWLPWLCEHNKKWENVQELERCNNTRKMESRQVLGHPPELSYSVKPFLRNEKKIKMLRLKFFVSKFHQCWPTDWFSSKFDTKASGHVRSSVNFIMCSYQNSFQSMVIWKKSKTQTFDRGVKS